VLEGGMYQYRLKVQHCNRIAGLGFQLPRFCASSLSLRSPANMLSAITRACS
jgi:hypothetical protein